MSVRLAIAAIVCLLCARAGDFARAEPENDATLRVCLNEELPPFSVRSKDGGSGFDLLMAQALAKRLDRGLTVQWYESKLDEDASTAIEANA